MYSVEGLPIKLSDAAVSKIKHAYNGEPLLITFQMHSECCSEDCGACCIGPCLCLEGCNPAFAYSDDSVIVNGIWFGRKDAARVSTMWSDMGCMCFVSRQIQMMLTKMLFTPPSACSELCAQMTCCPSPPLINHLFLDQYECKVVTDHPRLTSTATVQNEERRSVLPDTMNPLYKTH